MWCVLLSLIAGCPLPITTALSQRPPHLSSRRDALIGAASTAVANGLVLTSPTVAVAAPLEADTVDLAAFNAARSNGGGGGPRKASTPGLAGTSITGASTNKVRRAVFPGIDPAPLLPLRGGKGGGSTVQIPRVGYSLYKTPPERAAGCTSLALRCGVRHLDVGTVYGSNAEVAKPLKLYLDNGVAGLKKGYPNDQDENAGLLDLLLDATAAVGERHALQTMGSRPVAPPLDGSPGRRGRRDQLFVAHKLANEEQSTDVLAVKRRVKGAIAELGVGYLDLVSIHSPLTDKDRRLATYQALLELRDSGFVRAVGTCNYGIGPLEEIAAMVGGDTRAEDLPSINQLELSPFNRHEDVVRYCDARGIAVGCAAWSKLSGDNGPAKEWAALADLAKAKGVTKAQLLVRWSLQKGYACVPRSGNASRAERAAIAENSYGGVNSDAGAPFTLNQEDFNILDGLDVGYKSGRLGRRDGWDDADVAGPEWDPTEVV